MSSTTLAEEYQQVPDSQERAIVRRNPEIRFRYTFGDRKYKMDGRPHSEYTDFAINLKPVPRENTKDIREIAKTYKAIMQDPEVLAMQQQGQRYNFVCAVCVVFVFGLFIWFANSPMNA